MPSPLDRPHLPKIFVTGASGQDGLILCHGLDRLPVETIAAVRRPGDRQLIKAFAPRAQTVVVDLEDIANVRRVVRSMRPSFIFNLGGISSVKDAEDSPDDAWLLNFQLVKTLLDAMRSFSHSCKLVQASSARVFEGALTSPQCEETPLAPQSVYAQTKAAALEAVEDYRTRYSLHASNAILYSHESPLRSLSFVTRKISHSVAAAAEGIDVELRLGDANARRDWGWAPEYVGAMVAMSSLEVPEDLVVSTGRSHDVRQFLGLCLDSVSPRAREHLALSFDQTVPDTQSHLQGSSERIHELLGWKASRSLSWIAAEMVASDRRRLQSTSFVWHPHTEGLEAVGFVATLNAKGRGHRE